MAYLVGFGGAVTVLNQSSLDVTFTVTDVDGDAITVYTDTDRSSSASASVSVSAGSSTTVYFANDSIATITVKRFGATLLTRTVNITNGISHSIALDASSDGSSYPLRSIKNKTANYTLAAGDDIVTVNATGGAVTITLPAAATFSGYEFVVKKTDASVNAVTVSGAQNVDGDASVSLDQQWEAVTVVSNGTIWLVI